MLVKEVMTSKMQSVAPDLSVQECARKMRDLNIGSLPVAEKGKMVGMITDRDICCRAVADGRDLAKTTAAEIMSKDVSWCFDDQDCADAAHLMEDKHIRRLTVLNRDKAPVGLLSIVDLARCSRDLAGGVLVAASGTAH